MLFGFLEVTVLRSLYILHVSSLSDVRLVNIFSQSFHINKWLSPYSFKITAVSNIPCSYKMFKTYLLNKVFSGISKAVFCVWHFCDSGFQHLNCTGQGSLESLKINSKGEIVGKPTTKTSLQCLRKWWESIKRIWKMIQIKFRSQKLTNVTTSISIVWVALVSAMPLVSWLWVRMCCIRWWCLWRKSPMETLVQTMMLMNVASWANHKKTMPTLNPALE